VVFYAPRHFDFARADVICDCTSITPFTAAQKGQSCGTETVCFKRGFPQVQKNG